MSPFATFAGTWATTTSTASSSAPTAVVHWASGAGTMGSRDSSMPYSAAASALIDQPPTSAHQAPSAEAAPSRASSSDTDPVHRDGAAPPQPVRQQRAQCGQDGQRGHLPAGEVRRVDLACADRYVEHFSSVEQTFEYVKPSSEGLSPEALGVDVAVA